MENLKFLIDTTVFIDFSRGHPNVIRWFKKFLDEPERLATSSLVVTEFFCGIHYSKIEKWKSFFEPFEILSPGYGEALKAAEFYRSYKEKGISLAIIDILHGTLAKEKGYIVATSNIKHFPFVETYDPRNYE